VLFAHDTWAALTLATDLVNTLRPDGDALPDAPALDEFLGRHHVSAPRPAAEADLAAVRALRPRLRAGGRLSRPAPAAPIPTA
jgi:hypothetical protein